MRCLHFPAAAGRRAPTLAVMLAPAEARADDLVRAGFVDALRRSGAAVDLDLPELDFADITNGSALPWLRQEVIAPARAAGYSTLWLGGISLGAYLSINYDACYPGEVDGLHLFAPYPGSRLMWSEVVAGGGVRRWQAGAVADDDHERRLWHWLQRQPTRRTPVHLAIAGEDRFADGQAVLATAFADADVDRVAGRHDWAAWQLMWERFIARRLAGGKLQ